MILNKLKIKESLSNFNIIDGRRVLTANFLKLSSPLRERDRRLISHQIIRKLRFIGDDLWNIITVSLRLDWQRRLYIDKQINPFLFFQFSTCDANQFHVYLRSLFDYTGEIIRLISKPGQLRKRDTFQTIKNRIDKLEEAGVIEAPLASIIREQEWFDDIREVRNLDVHRGGRTFISVDEVSGRLIFQMFTAGSRKKINIPEISYNENTVFFDSYIAMCFGYLIDYLEKLAIYILNKIDLNLEEEVYLTIYGLEVLYQWMNNIVID